MNALALAMVFVFLLVLASFAVAIERGQFSNTQATPAAPISDEATQTRVRELICTLRNHRVFERSDEWGSAIRELTAIGKPAQPELLLARISQMNPAGTA